MHRLVPILVPLIKPEMRYGIERNIIIDSDPDDPESYCEWEPVPVAFAKTCEAVHAKRGVTDADMVVTVLLAVYLLGCWRKGSTCWPGSSPLEWRHTGSAPECSTPSETAK
jgi:hypothetical protein